MWAKQGITNSAQAALRLLHVRYGSYVHQIRSAWSKSTKPFSWSYSAEMSVFFLLCSVYTVRTKGTVVCTPYNAIQSAFGMHRSYAMLNAGQFRIWLPRTAGTLTICRIASIQLVCIPDTSLYIIQLSRWQRCASDASKRPVHKTHAARSQGAPLLCIGRISLPPT